jgi:hypothetical protein
LARKYPERLIGIHLTDVGYPDQNTDFSQLTPAEMEMAQWVQKWFEEPELYVGDVQDFVRQLRNSGDDYVLAAQALCLTQFIHGSILS